jgi:hypothetical protein
VHGCKIDERFMAGNQVLLEEPWQMLFSSFKSELLTLNRHHPIFYASALPLFVISDALLSWPYLRESRFDKLPRQESKTP